jgi:dipeptidyl aminopeptidase/acylaminoacyl peptidase
MRRFAIALGVILVATVMKPASAALAPQFTMEAILSAPFVDNLTASSDGNAVAWSADERGLRNIYFSASGSTRRISSYFSDDGQALSELSVLPDDSGVVYVRGTGPNGQGEIANPASNTTPPTEDVWLLDMGGGKPVHVGLGSQPAVSPHGDSIAWVSHGQMWLARIQRQGATLRVVGAAQAFTIRGSVRGLRWSPVARQIAFANDRGDHSFVAIYDTVRHTLSYASPGFNSDDYPEWSPDGSSLAFVRTPGLREDYSEYFLGPEAPWSVWVARSDGSGGHAVWTANTSVGWQFYALDDNSQLFWSRDNQIAFPWEGDGWRHMYAVPATGGQARLLTPGQFEVESVTQRAGNGPLTYATNEGDIDRRHIWQVAFDGSAPQALTSGSDDQWSPAPIRTGGLAFVNAGFRYPTAVEEEDAPLGSARSLGGAPVPSEYPAANLVQPQLVTFNAPDGLLIHAQLFVPNDGLAVHPAIVFDHGGSERQMLPGFHYLEFYSNLYESNQYYANHGCVVLSINYRSGIMYGHDFRMAPHVGAQGAAEYQDVLAGAKFLQNRTDVDPKRMGIYGLSYGGYLTALALARNSDIFKVGVDFAGVHNWATLIDWDDGHQVGTPEQRQIAYDSSPIASVATWRSPVFLSQGDDDRNVAFSQGLDLAQRLRAQGVEVEQLVIPNETHEESLVFAHMVELYDASSAFMLRRL